MKLFSAVLIALLIGPVAQAETIGVVLMHGKQGTPQQFEGLSAALEQAGFSTERPEMCWSRQRIYDLAYLDCLRDVDAAAMRLRQRGATAIVIAGQSLGGNGAFGYGARHQDLKGVIAMAPAHAPQFLINRPEIASSVATAQAMIAQGKGGEQAEFTDVNTGPGASFYNFQVTTSAAIYVSFFAPDSPSLMGPNVAGLTAPLLLISGDNDPTQRAASALFARVPPRPFNRYVNVVADHLGTPAASRDVILSWLADLSGK